jgi:hypothetical protein
LYLDITVLTSEDIILAIGSAAIVAGGIISLSVLSRYRLLTVQLANSNELARDLWSALDNRMKKQDERIVDLMAKVEIYGVKAEAVVPKSALKSVARSISTPFPRADTITPRSGGGSNDVEKNILQRLVEGSKSSTEIKTIIGKSREHTARLMKSLFDDGYVIRNDRERPFVYEITESGRRYLADNRSADT